MLLLRLQQGRLQRNFQGYATAGQNCTLGLGASSISQINGHLWQYAKDLKDYYAAIERGHLPVIKGFQSTRDDQLRAALITYLICHFELNIKRFCDTSESDSFWDYFAEAEKQLRPFIDDHLVEVNTTHVRVSVRGRLWVRSICACFDAYLNHGQATPHYSKVV